jgi:hypothetical protein
MHHDRIPVIPEAVLKTHKVNEPSDTRFKAAARLLQTLWRQDAGLPIGSHRSPDGKRRKLGSRINTTSAQAGANFLNADIANLARREVVYREPGAVIDQERLWTNLLSSQPLCFNFFGALKLDQDKANRFFRTMFPGYVERVEGIIFEHSPGRGDPAFTADHSAFDVFVPIITTTGESGFVAIEVKYSETMMEPLAQLKPRYNELSASAQVFNDPTAQALREAPLQQLWREHLLSRAMVENGLYGQGRFVVIHPEQNTNCAAAVRAYRRHLASSDPAESGFDVRTLDECVTMLATIGDEATASALRARYLDFARIDRAIFGE